METTVLKVSRREQAKNERRSRIVNSTRVLLRELGSDRLSLKDVAERAGVSLATVYNLFASKEAIFAGIYRDDAAKFEHSVITGGSDNALDRIFDAIDLGASWYEADPGYLPMIMWGRLGNYWALNSEVFDDRLSMWRRFIERAIADGFLRPRTDPEVVGTLLVQCFSGAMAGSISGQISASRYRGLAKLGCVAVLSLFATNDAKLRLGILADELEAELSAQAHSALTGCP